MGNIVDVPAAVIGRWEQESVVGSEGALVLKSAGVAFPHVDKEGRGEDAFFVSGSKAGMFGVADGVGGWNMEGVDPGEFSRLLANNARRGMEAPDAR